MTADSLQLIRGHLRDDGLTRGLGDIEARMLVDWTTDWAEVLATAARTADEAANLVRRVFRRGQAIGRFVLLWCDIHPKYKGAAVQLAAVERFHWPLPVEHIEAPDLMKQILAWESEHR